MAEIIKGILPPNSTWLILAEDEFTYVFPYIIQQIPPTHIHTKGKLVEVSLPPEKVEPILKYFETTNLHLQDSRK